MPIELRNYRLACEAIPPTGCSHCSLAYDCQRLRKDRRWNWPAVGVFLLSVVAVLGSLV